MENAVNLTNDRFLSGKDLLPFYLPKIAKKSLNPWMAKG